MLIRLIIVISVAPWEAYLSDPYHFVGEPSGRFPAGGHLVTYIQSLINQDTGKANYCNSCQQ